ncbi:phage terminase large subunit GpA-like protein [Chryseobacterium sp. 7]|jgi:phage terminase large subunit GpA-like protein|uniref:phage terminase large subunit family protein n=1 Tax=Chryseobacterium sp. 7 TaxID=2035214 RepID=UPI000EB20FB6|nr:phage terminase large subunit family protein [Chryseobacterium sp. 7]RLJ34205.1 phage terminase large subunit GpA-like protein [Chryseobacterium sp. 7]
MLIKGFLDALQPEPILSVSQWADQNRLLDSKSSAMPGKYRTSITPFLKEIMDHLGEYSPVEEVIVMKGAQLGVTEAGINWIGYTIDVSPCPMLFVEPTKEVVELVSKTRIQPMLESSPSLAHKVKPPKSRDSGNTLTKKEFPGGILRLAGANSAAGLRNMPVKRLMLDEVDAYPVDLDTEGNPIDLAKKRTSTFAKRKIFILSTPVTKGLSVIEPLFESTDQRYFFLPCPHCGALQHLKWENLKYQYNKSSKVAKEVYYQCEHCQEGIQESEKTKMLESGVWIPTKPENQNKKRVGYHINSLYSPLGWKSWEDLAIEYEEAIGDVPKMKTFYNTSLGLTYEESGDKPQWEALYDRREDYPRGKIPTDEIAFLTAGVDIQKDRIELEIVGWCEGKVSYSIDYRVLMGFVAGDGSAQVWQKLDAVLNETWIRPDGTQMSIRMMCVDSGNWSSEVYAFCGRYPPSRVVPIKGRDNQITIISAPKAVNVTRKNKSVDGVKVWHVGVSLLKSELYGWLRVNPGDPGYCHFPMYDEAYFKGLTSEELITTKNKNGHTVQRWVKKFTRNEPLDIRNYARAAAHMVGMDSFSPKHWELMRNKRTGAVKNKVKKKSDFWN